MNNNYYVLYYTVIKNRDDKDNLIDKNENIENNYINFHNLITPNHYKGRKIDKIIFKKKNLRYQINHFNILLLHKWRRKNE